MDRNLFLSAVLKFSAGAASLWLLLFLPAGSSAYWQGWQFLGILLIPMFLAGLVMMKWNPALLRSRLRAKENRKDQSLVIRLSGLMFLAGFLLAGFTWRFQWMVLPGWVSLLPAAVFLAAYGVYGEVLRENTYLSRTIQVQENQQVVDTGLYGIVRHPMYAVTLVLFLAMPLVLGSFWSFLVFLFYPVIIVKRIRGEEKFLEKELPGYIAYEKKVPWRLIPYLW